LTEVFQHASDKLPSNRLFIVISSDRGLCGGIHSSVSKATRKALSTPLAGQEDVSVDFASPVGDKSKGKLSRTIPKNLHLTFNQIDHDIPTFADAAGVADLITKSGVKYDSVVLVYNKFVSVLSYAPLWRPRARKCSRKAVRMKVSSCYRVADGLLGKSCQMNTTTRSV
jgi:F-type H+-transporting ATPase subunit gamma